MRGKRDQGISDLHTVSFSEVGWGSEADFFCQLNNLDRFHRFMRNKYVKR